jgi:hypothetical protein
MGDKALSRFEMEHVYGLISSDRSDLSIDAKSDITGFDFFPPGFLRILNIVIFNLSVDLKETVPMTRQQRREKVSDGYLNFVIL